MKKLITLTLAMMLFVAPIFSQSTSTKADQLDQLFTHCSDNNLFNGTVLVSENGKVIYRKAFGYADIEAGEKLTPESSFYLASVSKQFTTMAVMILKEKGKLSYDDKLSKFFPEFPDYAEGVTVRHLMTHTSGVPDHYRLGAYRVDLTNADVKDLLVKQEKLDFEPGERYSYSNGGYVMLAMIVEKASGMPFHKFMKKNIFDPLKMKSTLVYDESKPEVKNRAKGHHHVSGYDDYEILTSGAGGMYSVLDDLHKWDQALYTEKLVSKETLKEAYTSAKLNNGDLTDYGFGWGIQQTDDGKIVQHSGGMNGYRTFIRRDLSNNNCHIILTNKGDALAMGGINTAIANILNGEKFDLPKIPLSGQLAKMLKESDTETAINDFKKMIEAESDKYELDEMGINSLGYVYMNEKDYETAIEVFKLNVELFPNSSNTYDSLGEAYMENGQNGPAIKHYKKSIELNPNNENGISMLKKMGLDESELRQTITLPEKVMDTYVGKYELQPGFILEISREGDKMYILPTGQQKSEIFPASVTRFYSKIVDAQITFNKGDNGKIVSLTLHQGGDYEAKKLE